MARGPRAGAALAAVFLGFAALACLLLPGLGPAALAVFGSGPEVIPHPPAVLVRPAPSRGPRDATLLFAGDTALADAALPTLEARGLTWPFRLTVDLVRDADLAVVNAEAPITDRPHRTWRWQRYRYRAPAEAARALAWAGVDVLGLANNHALDQGPLGLLDTEAHAAAAGLATVGAGEDEAAARRGLVVTMGGLKVGLLAFCERKVSWRLGLDLGARRGHAGVAEATEGALAADLARLRPQVDVLVVMVHAGETYAPPTAEAVRLMRRAVAGGADLVIGHHPHVAHPILVEGGRPILLSLGNYAFGTPGHPALHDGWLALAQIEGGRLARVELVPLAVQNARVAFQPAPLDGDERDRALEALREASAARGTLARVERGRLVVPLSP